MEQITSRENTAVKRAAKLIASKKERAETGLFVAEGARLAEEAALCGVVIREFFCTAEAMEKYAALLEPLLRKAARSALISPAVADKLSDTHAPQGVFCVCERPAIRLDPARLPAGRYLALESLQDPGNLGTIVRTADAFALDGLLLTADCPDLLSPKVLRSTMGSAFRVPAVPVGDLPAFLEKCSATHRTFAAVPDRDAPSARSCGLKGPVIVAIGNEGAGLTARAVAACRQKLTIPMPGRAESLNAAVAAAVIMWEMADA